MEKEEKKREKKYCLLDKETDKLYRESSQTIAAVYLWLRRYVHFSPIPFLTAGRIYPTLEKVSTYDNYQNNYLDIPLPPPLVAGPPYANLSPPPLGDRDIVKFFLQSKLFSGKK